MKEFIRYTLATLCGLFIFVIILTVAGTLTLVGMASTAGNTPDVDEHSILRLTLNGELKENATESPLEEILYSSYPSTSLKDILDAIAEAKENENIDGIYIEAKDLTGAVPAMVREIREALADFKKSGKFIIAYGDHYTQGCYYIASVADKIVLNPRGEVNWHGMASQPIYYKDLLERLGIRMQVFKVGSYKSAVEPFTTTGMSEANREQVTSYLNDIWKTMLADVAASRKLSVEQVNAYADSLTMLWPAERTVEAGMADTVCHIDGVSAMLRAKVGKEKGMLPLVSVKALAATAKQGSKKGGKVAVYHAFGDIVDLRPDWGDAVIDAETMCRDLKKLREDKSVKAVVLRVNSGGGSAYASEQIWDEVRLLGEAKPVVVSMGGRAASGGYYISCAASYIMTEPTTLTGSIGIYGLIPDVSQLLGDKLGLHFDVVKTNSHADFGTMSRPFNPEEAEMVMGYIQRGYTLFIDRVAQGRHMEKAKVEQLAGGRVWTGRQAVENGLADSCGCLRDAIKKAAELAKLEEYRTEYAPEPSPWYEDMFGKQKKDYLSTTLHETLGEYYVPVMNLIEARQTSPLQARIPFETNLID